MQKQERMIKMAVTTVGDLKFEKARPALYKMAANKKYEDIFPEIDYALEKITGRASPKGDAKIKRVFWSKASISETTI